MAKRPETAAGQRLLRIINYLDYDAHDAGRWYWDGVDGKNWPEVLAEIEEQAAEKARAECEGYYFSGS